MAKQLNIEMNVSANTAQAKQQLESLQKTLSNLASGRGLNFKETPMTKSLQESLNVASKLKSVLNDATNPSTGKLDLTAFTKGMRNLGLEAKDVKKHLLSLGPEGTQAFIQMTRSIQQADAPLVSLNRRMSSLLTTLKNTAKWQISSSILHGFMSAVSGAYHYAQDLNESLNNIRIVTGQNADQMARFAEQANESAKALSSTTKAYTDASLIYYQQGLNDDQVKERTDITVKMANVTRDSAEKVSQQMTAVWNNFDDGSKKLEYYADVMTALGAATASSSDEIATGLEKFAAVAETAGMSYEYAASALATITATTRQSADTVGTGLRTVLSRIESLNLGETLEDGVGLTKYTEALQSIGVEVLDMNGHLKGADQILNDMAEKWQGLSKAQKMATAETVGGVRQYATIMALMDNWDFMQQNLKTSYGATGTLQEQADIYAESWEAAGKRVEAAAQKIYDDLINDDFFIDLLDGAEKVLTFIDDLIKSLGGLPGLLSTISTLLFGMFGDKIANGVTNVVQSLALLTPKGREMQKTEREKWTRLGENTGVDSSSAYENAVSNRLKANQDMDAAMTENAEKFSEEQQRANGFIRDSIDLEYENIAALSKRKDELEKIIALTKQSIMGNTKGEEFLQQEALDNYARDYKNAQNVADNRNTMASDIYNSVYKNASVHEIREKNNNYMASFFDGNKEKVEQLYNEFEQLDDVTGDFFKSIKEKSPDNNAFKELQKDCENLSEKEKKALQQALTLKKELSNRKGSSNVFDGVSDNKKKNIKTNAGAIKATAESAGEASKQQLEEDIKENMSGGTGAAKEFTQATQELIQVDEQLEVRQEAVNLRVKDFVNALKESNSFQNWATGLTTIAQGVSMFSMGINSAVGSINTLMDGIISGEMSFSQLLSSFTSLGMAFTMIVPQVGKLASSLTKTTTSIIANTIATKAETAEKGKNLVATLLQIAADKDMTNVDKKAAVAKALETAGIESATVAHWAELAVIELKEIALKKYMIIALAAIAVVAALVTIFTKAREAEIKAHKDSAQLSKERSEQLKEEADANKELVDTYKEALETWKTTGESKAALEDAARKVAAAYGIENTAIMIQKGNYEQLTKAINEARKAELEKLKSARETAANDAEAVAADSMHSFGDTYNYNTADGRLNTHIETGGTSLTKIIAQARDQLNLGDIIDFGENNFFGSDLIARAEDTKEGFIEIYEAYQQLRDLMAEMASEQGINYANDFAFKNLNTWLTEHKEAYEGLKAALEDLQNVNIDLEVLNVFGNKDPKNFKEFNEGFNQIIENLKETGLNATEAKKALDLFFANSDNQVLKDFNQTKNVVEDVEQQLSKLNSKDAEAIKKLMSGSFSDPTTLANMNLALVKSVDSFKQLYQETQKYGDALNKLAKSQSVVEKISNAVSKIKDNMSSTDMLELQEAIDWGKDGLIEFTEFLQKTSEEQQNYLNTIVLENYFNQLKSISQEIDYTIQKGTEAASYLKANEGNKLIQQGLEIEAAWKDAYSIFEKFYNIDYEQISNISTILQGPYSYAASDDLKQKYQEQAQEIADTLQIPIETVLDNNREKIAQAFKEKINPEALGLEKSFDVSKLLDMDEEELKATLGSAFNKFKEQYGSALSTYRGYEQQSEDYSPAQLKQLQEQQAMAQELTMQSVANTYGVEDVDALKSYAGTLQDILETESEVIRTEEQKSILSAKMAGDIFQTQKGLDNLNKTFSDYADQLQDINKLDVKTNEGFAEIAKNIKQIFGVDVSNNALIDNLEDLRSLANGNTEAFKKLSKEFAKDYIKSVAGASKETEALNKAIDDIDYDNLKVGDELSEDVIDAFNHLMATGQMTAEEVTNSLNSLGYNVDFTDVGISIGNFNAALQELRFNGVEDVHSLQENLNSMVESYVSSMDYLQGIQPDLGSPIANAIAEVTAQLVNAGYDYNEAYNMALDMIQGQLDVEDEEISTSQDAGAQSTSRWHFSGSMQIGDGEPTEVSGDFENTTTAEGSGDGKIHLPVIGKGAGGGGTSYNGTPSSATATPHRSSGGGGGGGGGGSQKAPKRQGKIKTEKVEVERYKEITDSIEDLTRVLDEASAQSDRLWGNNKIKAIEKQNALIKQQIANYKERIKQEKEWLKVDQQQVQNVLNKQVRGQYEGEDSEGNQIFKDNYFSLQEYLKKYGFEYEAVFDENGNLVNYTELMGGVARLKDIWNDELVKHYEGATKEEYDEQIALWYEPLDEIIKEFEDAIKQADETAELYKDDLDEIAEMQREIQDNNFTMITYKLEVKLIVDDTELAGIEHYIEKLADDFYLMGENLANYSDKIDNTITRLQHYKEEEKDLTTAYVAGEIAESDYFDQLQEISEAYYENLSTLKELDDFMKHYFGDTLEAGQEEFDKYQDRLEHLTDTLEHYKEIMELTGKAKNYEMMNKLTEASIKNAQNTYETSVSYYQMLKAQKDTIENELSQMEIGSSEYEFKLQQLDDITEKCNEAQDSVLEHAEAIAELFQQQWELALEETKKNFEKFMTDGSSFDQLQASMDRLSSYQDVYLTKTNQEYEMNQMLRQLQTDSDKTQNIAAKQRIASFAEEMKQLKNKNELSKLDLDIAKARYQQMLAEIALEEAQNAKSMVRLRRDDEGNYGYVYTADQNKIAEAENELAKANNDLYNIVLNGANEYGQKAIELAQKFQEDLAALIQKAQEEDYYGTERYYNERAQLQKEYEKLSIAYTDQYNTSVSWLNEVATTDYKEAWVTTYENVIEKTANWNESTKEYVSEIESKATELKNKLNELIEGEGGIKSIFGDFETAIKNVETEGNNLKEALVGEGGIVEKIKEELNTVLAATNAYLETQQQDLINVIAQYEKYAKAIEEAIIQQKALNDLNNPNENQQTTPEEPSPSSSSGPDVSQNNGNNQTGADHTKRESFLNYGFTGNYPYRDYYVDGQWVGSSSNYTESARIVQELINAGIWGKNWPAGSWTPSTSETADEIFRRHGFDTGGYTGEWGSQGKLAMLHEKELILNKQDTSNILSSIEIVRQIAQSIDLQALSAGITALSTAMPNLTASTLQQDVTIHAEFPNVTDHNEIEMALDSLVNRATQYAGRF